MKPTTFERMKTISMAKIEAIKQSRNQKNIKMKKI